MLADEGKLSMNDPVAKYYPALTRAADITLDDLGGHISGYRDYYPLDFLDARMRKPIEHDKLIADYAGTPLDFEPRTRWSYSNTGFIVLGRVVEKVSNEPLAAFFKKRIFEPAQMAHAVLDPDAAAPGLARGYTAFAMGDPEPAERDRPGWLFGAGGVYASATDLAKWDLAFMDGKLLGAASQRRMTAKRELANHRASNYGCGLVIGDRRGETVLSHGGEVSGFLAENAMIPRTRSAVVVLSNRDDVSPSPIHEQILRLLLEEQIPKPAIQGPPAAEAARELVSMLQAGTIDRAKLGADYDEYLSDARVRGARKRLEAMGTLKSCDVERIVERGGMEVAVLRIGFESKSLRGLMYRTPDGKIQELFLSKP
jgi:CubicO group peptidase (beta-lactamase class C family)